MKGGDFLASPINWVNDYFKVLTSYRDKFDIDVARGKMGVEKARRLVDKLNEWYDVAKIQGKLRK